MVSVVSAAAMTMAIRHTAIYIRLVILQHSDRLSSAACTPNLAIPSRPFREALASLVGWQLIENACPSRSHISSQHPPRTSPSVSSACLDRRPLQIWQEDKSAPWSNDDLLSRQLLPSAGLGGSDWPLSLTQHRQHTHHQASCFFSFCFFFFLSFSSSLGYCRMGLFVLIRQPRSCPTGQCCFLKQLPCTHSPLRRRTGLQLPSSAIGLPDWGGPLRSFPLGLAPFLHLLTHSCWACH